MKLFQGNGQLDEDVEDILYELGNVGVGNGQYNDRFNAWCAG